MKDTIKLPCSALLVSCNEGFLLEDCLKSIQFCDEIVLVNLESKDNTEELGKKYATRIVNERRVELVEELFPLQIPQLRNDWILLIDPDERVDPELVDSLTAFFKAIPNDCGKINVPILYYYKLTALKGTVWGGEKKTGRLLIRRSACNISSKVHNAIELKETFYTYKIGKERNNVDHHYWVQSYEQMLEKHKRYLKKEGKAKYEKGERFSYLRLLKQTFSSFWECYVTYKGYKDGVLGIFLSGFYAWYIGSSWLSLRKYERNLKHAE